jgi:hypothetical protein
LASTRVQTRQTVYCPALITDERRYASLLAGRQVYVVHHGLRRGTMVGPTCGSGPTTVPVRKNHVPIWSALA